jgi:hypothetical protein
VVTVTGYDEALAVLRAWAPDEDLKRQVTVALGTELIISAEGSDRAGHRTREYVIFGGDWWLYALNRIAEQPDRVVTALADLNHLIVRRD